MIGLATMVEERRTGMQDLLAAQERMEEKVEWLEEAIRGNGKPGINQRLALIENHLSRIDYWLGMAVKVLLPVLMSILALGLTGWGQAIT